jgi:hypothetical protein
MKHRIKILIITTFSIINMTLSIITFGIIKLSTMNFSIMTISIITVSISTFSIMLLCLTAFSIRTLVIAQNKTQSNNFQEKTVSRINEHYNSLIKIK